MYMKSTRQYLGVAVAVDLVTMQIDGCQIDGLYSVITANLNSSRFTLLLYEWALLSVHKALLVRMELI